MCSVYTSLPWVQPLLFGMLLSRMLHISTSVTPLRVCSLFPTALSVLLCSFIFSLLSLPLHLGFYLLLFAFDFRHHSFVAASPFLYHLFGKSGAARGSRQMNRALSVISHSFMTANKINSLQQSNNHLPHMDYCKPNIILSII